MEKFGKGIKVKMIYYNCKSKTKAITISNQKNNKNVEHFSMCKTTIETQSRINSENLL